MSAISTSSADPGRWICIYPLYINSKKTIAQGRRIVQSKAVENPTSQEINDVVEHGAGLPCKIERKMHPRDPNRDSNAQGRVRIQLKNEDGTLINDKFPTRKSVMLFATEMIPKLKTRQPTPTAGNSQQANAGSKQKKKK